MIAFFTEENVILNEKTIIQKEGNLIKHARMVLTSTKEIYLLDYKTGSHQAKYTKQLENYQDAIEKMNYRLSNNALV